jgi:hypothetical protein
MYIIKNRFYVIALYRALYLYIYSQLLIRGHMIENRVYIYCLHLPSIVYFLSEEYPGGIYLLRVYMYVAVN